MLGINNSIDDKDIFTIKPKSKFNRLCRKASYWWYKVFLRKIGFFKRYKSVKQDYKDTLGFKAECNSATFTEEEKRKLNKEHGRRPKKQVDVWAGTVEKLEERVM